MNQRAVFVPNYAKIYEINLNMELIGDKGFLLVHGANTTLSYILDLLFFPQNLNLIFCIYEH